MKVESRKIWSFICLLAFMVLLGSCEKNDLIEPDPDPVNYLKSFGGDGPDDSEDTDEGNSDEDCDITDDEDDQDDGDITDDEDDQDDSESRSNAILTTDKK